MSVRELRFEVVGEFVQRSGKVAGVQGEGNATTLYLTFDESWDGYSKRLIWRDARGENPTAILLVPDLLTNAGEGDTRSYAHPIPSEPLAVAGWCSVTIEGYKEDEPNRVAYTVTERLEVKERSGHGSPAEPTPSQAQQLQQGMDKVLGQIVSDANDARQAATTATEQAELATEKAAEAVEAADAAQANQEEAAQSEEAAKSSQEDAAKSKEAAELARLAAEKSAAEAETAARLAQEAQDNADALAQAALAAATTATEERIVAVKAAEAAELAARQAHRDALAAEDAKELSEGARDVARLHRDNAAASLAEAQKSQAASYVSQQEAEASAGRAALSAKGAQESQDAVKTDANRAQYQAQRAAEHRTDAEEAADLAGVSERNAKASEQAAKAAVESVQGGLAGKLDTAQAGPLVREVTSTGDGVLTVTHKDGTQDTVDTGLSQRIRAGEVGNAGAVRFVDGDTMQQKLDRGDLNGRDGVAVTVSGLFALHVADNGDLILAVADGAEAPPICLDADGNLIYTI